MCSHIFIALGMWDAVVSANEVAVKLTGGVAAPNRPPAACGHYPFWLTYGYLQQGRIEAAKTMVKNCHATGAGHPLRRHARALSARYRRVERRHRVAAWDVDTAACGVHQRVRQRLRAIRRGDVSAARASLARMQDVRKTIEAAAKPPIPHTPACRA